MTPTAPETEADAERERQVEQCLRILCLGLSAEGKRWDRAVLAHIAGRIVDLGHGTEETRLERRAQQRGQIELLGLSPTKALALMRAVRAPEGSPDEIVETLVYHPVRFRAALARNPEIGSAWTAHRRSDRRADGDAGDDPLAAVLARITREPVSEGLPGDKVLAGARTAITLEGLATTTSATYGGLIDAEAWLTEPANTGAGMLEAAVAPGDLPRNLILYLHFGRDALPSPYPGMGVEGCYVIYANREAGDDCTLMPVVSTPRDQGTPLDHPLRDPIGTVCRDHARSYIWLGRLADLMAGNALPLVQKPKNPIGAVTSVDWAGSMPGVFATVRQVLTGLIRGEARHVTIAEASRDLLCPFSEGQPSPGIFVLGTALGSAQQPDEGGGFPLASEYWTADRIGTWITAFQALHARKTSERSPAVLKLDRHGWADRTVRLIQQVVPRRHDLPDLADRPATRAVIIRFLSEFPPGGSTLMPLWQALRWLMILDPLEGQFRIHGLIAASVDDPSLQDIVHVLHRELPDQPSLRQAWADVVRCYADAKLYPPAADTLAGLIARAYHADPAVAVALLDDSVEVPWHRIKSRAALLAEARRSPHLEHVVILAVYATLLRQIADERPDTMRLLRADTSTRH